MSAALKGFLALVCAAALLAGGLLLGSTAAVRADSVAGFCAEHADRSGFWTGAPPSAGWVRQTVSAARGWPGQFDGVAGTVCGQLAALDSGRRVHIEGVTGGAATRAELTEIVRRLERLPEATAAD